MRKTSYVNLADIELLIDLAKTHSIRATARKFHKEPSGISKVLKKLEAQIKFKLFDRSAVGLVLTPQGKVFIDDATNLLLHANSLLKKKQNSKSDQKILLTLAGVSFIQSYVTPRIHRSTELSHVRFRFLEMLPDNVIEASLRGAADVAIHLGEQKWTRNWKSVPLGTVTFSLFAAKDHPLRNVDSIENVLRYPFVVPTYWNGKNYEPGNDLFPIGQLDRLLGDEVSTAELALQIVANSQQVAFIPKFIFDFHNSLTVKTVEVNEIDREISLPLFLSFDTGKISKNLLQSLVEALRFRD